MALFAALGAARRRDTRLLLTNAGEQVRSTLREIRLSRALSHGGDHTG
ncbi:hypothetical protein [Streptomyces cadmiisoli]